jgi:hypothetical protein
MNSRYGSIAILTAFVSLVLFLVVSPSPVLALTSTTTTVSCSSPVTVGSQSTCTITVAPSAATGMVDNFMSSGSGNFGATSCTLSMSGSCTVTYTPYNVSGSPHIITATYAGDSTYATSTSTGAGDGSVAVNPIQSSIGVSCAPSPVRVGLSTLCTATVTGASPTGPVSLLDSGGQALVTVPASCVLVVTGPTTSSCNVTVTTSGAGVADIQASYSGDANNLQPTSAALTVLTVSEVTTTTSVSCVPATVVVGQSTQCTATVDGYSPTKIVTWQPSITGGMFSSNPCTLTPINLTSSSCVVSFTPTASVSMTATYSGDSNNFGSSGMTSIIANINELIQITVANSGPAATVELSGCSVSPTAIQADGTPHSFTASSGCTGITVSLPPAGAVSQYLTAAGKSSLTIGSCSSSSCQTFSATIYLQLFNTYQVTPGAPASWSTAGSIAVTGTSLGNSGQNICTITVTTGPGGFSCQGWSDYNTQATLGSLQISSDQRWGTAQSSFTDVNGGTQHTSSYYSQVLDTFQYSLIGSTTAPSVPRLTYTAFGASAILPLTGSQSSSLVWLDTGSSWFVPGTLQGSTSTERWDNSLTSGAATAGQTVAISYYHQYLEGFSFSVSGGGTAYESPSVQYTSFGAPASNTTSGVAQGWADAGTSYSLTNPLVGSSAAERWYTSQATGSISAAGTISAVYYHQYAFALNFTVSGGGAYDASRLNYTSLGAPGVQQLNSTRTTFWLDAGTKWGVSQLLPSSSPTERWATKQASSGTAVASFEETMLYYHQYLGALHYTVTPSQPPSPVPTVNFTSFSAPQVASLGASPGVFWMDSGSVWQVPLTLPGAQGERWLSNVTAPATVLAPVPFDVQYTQQFYVEVSSSTPFGGLVANSNQWKDQGSSEILNATALPGWSFAYWKGPAPFSYNGTTRLYTLSVSGPANETAIFFPGLTIFTDNQGSVAYSYGTINGTVPAGANATIYPPPGRNVTLIAEPKSVATKFVGWKGGLTDSQLQSSIAIAAPTSVHASFATDYQDINTFVFATIVVFIAACFVFIIRRGFAPRLKPV